MAKRSRPDDILKCAVAWSASNYVVKLRASLFRPTELRPVGHIFDFATLRIRLSEKTHAIAEAIACDAVCNF